MSRGKLDIIRDKGVNGIVELQQIINKHNEQFKLDPLFRKIKDLNLVENLFSNEEYFVKISLTDTYSSRHAAELLSISGKEQTLVNYINREDLTDYLKVFRQGRYYRYDWITIFKFKMILLLNDHGFSPMEIATLAGNRVEFVQYDSESTVNNATPGSIHQVDLQAVEELISDSIDDFKHFLENDYSGRITTFMKFESLIQRKKEIESLIEKCEVDIRLRERDLKDREIYLKLFQMKNSTQGQSSSPGFFARLFNKNSAASMQSSNDAEVQTILDSLNESTDEIASDLEKLKEYKNTLCLNLEHANNDLLELQKSLEEENQVLTIPNERVIENDG